MVLGLVFGFCLVFFIFCLVSLGGFLVGEYKCFFFHTSLFLCYFKSTYNIG